MMGEGGAIPYGGNAKRHARFSLVSRSDSVDTQLLYMTRDGGVSWTAVKSNSQPGLNVDFVSERKGWSWSPDDLLLETEDGGATWNSILPQLVTP